MKIGFGTAARSNEVERGVAVSSHLNSESVSRDGWQQEEHEDCREKSSKLSGGISR